jgi:hypothetical protein
MLLCFEDAGSRESWVWSAFEVFAGCLFVWWCEERGSVKVKASCRRVLDPKGKRKLRLAGLEFGSGHHPGNRPLFANSVSRTTRVSSHLPDVSLHGKA